MNAGAELGHRPMEVLKTSVLAEGIRLSAQTYEVLSGGGQTPLSIHEYPTTGGITLLLDDDVYVNAPFDEWYCDQATTEMVVEDGRLHLVHSVGSFGVRSVLPLPGYLDRSDGSGNRVADVAMSHADRVRLSPIVGCAYNCQFCDLGEENYVRRSPQRLLDALAVAAADPALPARHVLISGGSPRRAHYDEFLTTCESVIRGSALPVDVMFSPLIDRPDFVDRLVDAGAAGFAVNIELFSEPAARDALGAKFLTSRRYFEATVLRAVDLLGREGRVRSLIIPGLEDPAETLRGVEYLASLGCDPVLSPFRPAVGTRLVHREPPSVALLLDVLDESRTIVAAHGVALGPGCTACQHNTLSFPWDVRHSSSRNQSAATPIR